MGWAFFKKPGFFWTLLSAACRHVPVSGGHFGGSIQAWLWKRRTYRPPGLSGTSSSVSTECGGTAHLPREIRGPHHRCSCQSLQSVCASPNGSRTRSPYWRTKFFTELRPHGIWVHSSVADLSGRRTLRSAGHQSSSGATCQTFISRSQPSVNISKHGFTEGHTWTSSSKPAVTV